MISKLEKSNFPLAISILRRINVSVGRSDVLFARILATLRIGARLISALQRYSIEALTELLDDLPQVVHVLLDDP